MRYIWLVLKFPIFYGGLQAGEKRAIDNVADTGDKLCRTHIDELRQQMSEKYSSKQFDVFTKYLFVSV